MSEATVTVRYDGPILANHQMDIADLAPALLGLSELCKIANRKFNGEKTSVKVLIGTDKEHQCFQFDLQVVQTFWESTKSVLSNNDVSSAKDMLDWIGLIGGGTTGAAVGLFKFLKWLKNRKITSTALEEIDGKNVVRITVIGNNNVIGDNNNVTYIHQQTMALLQDDKVLTNARKVVSPLLREGYDTVEFENTKNAESEVITREDAIDISAVTASDIKAPEIDAPQIITAWITVYSPVYDPRAPYWRFKFGDNHEYMDISDTDIAYQAIKRNGALVDDAYKVRLEITQEHKPDNTIKNNYKIIEVLDFKPSRLPHQSDAFKDEPPASGNSN